MNQRGGAKTFLSRLAATPGADRTVMYPAAAAAELERGVRLLFFELAGEGEDAKGRFVGWGDIDRISAEDDQVSVQLREYHPFRPRISFTELRVDPRRDRAAEVQPVSAEIFNTVLARARRG